MSSYHRRHFQQTFLYNGFDRDGKVLMTILAYNAKEALEDMKKKDRRVVVAARDDAGTPRRFRKKPEAND